MASLPNYGCDGLNQACPKQLDDYSTCVNGSTTTCGTDGCTGDGYSCSCTGQCNGYKVEVDCKGQPGSTVECQCLVGGGYVGSCQDESLSCDLLGCCSQYFPL